MLYNLFYYLLKLSCYLYFRKIRLYQTQNIPSKNPLIVCANHGNSFMDAILIAVLFKRKLHFLARADAFNSPFKRWFLSKINMMPIYRIKDGRDEVKNNDAIFEKCQRILENNGAILIFPEGNCVVEKRLRTFKAGFVQLAYEAKTDGLQILPVTLNYSKPLEFYTDVSLDFSKPIDVLKIKKQAQDDYIRFSKALIAETRVRISERMIVIPNQEEDEFYEQFLELTKNNLKEGFLIDQLKAIKFLNELKTDNLLFYNNLKEKLKHYFNQLSHHQITDEAVVFSDNYNQNLLFLTYSFYLFGVIIHYLPTSIIRYIVCNYIKEIQFKSAVRMVIGMFIYLIYVPILVVLASLFFDFGSIYLFGLLYFYNANFHQIKLMKQAYLMKSKNVNFVEEREKLIKSLNL
ncbi:1-acyl-sn-glycerol-3-phosphate acyltransferase [Pedobacter cryophilus]|uniref:Phospholipid/glycerol acyltransferase domain-containing protein n=1 Tax=Pedobacter cryophilus TaxID=2571271 RepID=A0A4V5NX86_9SPHI|nr:1-acyl-sn-glycerol-3-phosphate acyltransferase [Pedobacter cryophilus]TKB97727.1 hypothetical protein FA046_10210 [Pedobacter cryophilus]